MFRRLILILFKVSRYEEKCLKKETGTGDRQRDSEAEEKKGGQRKLKIGKGKFLTSFLSHLKKREKLSRKIS